MLAPSEANFIATALPMPRAAPVTRAVLPLNGTVRQSGGIRRRNAEKRCGRKEQKQEKLQAAFNRIQESDELFNGLFDDVDLYSNRLGTGDQKQSTTISDLIKVLEAADLIHTKGDVLGNAYEYLIGQFASETGKKAFRTKKLKGSTTPPEN